MSNDLLAGFLAGIRVTSYFMQHWGGGAEQNACLLCVVVWKLSCSESSSGSGPCLTELWWGTHRTHQQLWGFAGEGLLGNFSDVTFLD